MSTAIGKRMIDGGAVKYHSAVGNGIAGKVAAAAIRALGPKALEFAASKLDGRGFKITGEGKKKKKAGRPKKKKC